MNSSELLPAIRDRNSSNPEWLDLEPGELTVLLLYSLRCTNNPFEDEGEIAAAVEAARSDWLEAA